MSSKLNEEDQKRVEEYLSSPVHSVERKPFRPLRLLAVLATIIVSFSLVSLLLAWHVDALTLPDALDQFLRKLFDKK